MLKHINVVSIFLGGVLNHIIYRIALFKIIEFAIFLVRHTNMLLKVLI